MSQRRFRFHVAMISVALVIGSLSLWYSGFWMEGRNKVPNFTAIAMVLVVVSQGMVLRAVQKKEKQ